jgi:hypothetical protein
MSAVVALSFARLLSEPVLKHLAREPDMASNADTRHAARAHRLVNPARLDRQQVRRLLRTKQWTLGKRGHAVGCR